MRFIACLVLFVLCTIGSTALNAQSKNELRQQKKQERKALRSQQEELMVEALKQSVDNRAWVLEANRLQGRRGSVINVSSMLNFVRIDGERAVIQLGSVSGVGPNGVGGITFDGNVTRYEVDWNEKNGRYTIDIQMMSATASFTIRLNVDATGQMASAEISSNSPGRFSYLGQVVPLSESSIYKGSSLP